MKNTLVAILAGMMLIVGMQTGGLAAEAQAEELQGELRTGALQSEEFEIQAVESPEHEELFEEYVEQIFYDETNRPLSNTVIGSEELKGKEARQMYETLKAAICNIAAGRQTSTVVPVNMKLSWNAADLGVSKITSSNVEQLVMQKLRTTLNFGTVISYLLQDCPYEMYWYDKTEGSYYSFRYSYGTNVLQVSDLKVYLAVVPAYQGYAYGSQEKLYTLNTAMLGVVERAKANAQKIVEDTKYLSRYDRMVAFKDAICELTEYNHEAAEDPNPIYGDPWQMIWVFDGNPNTSVVCEGYSKAFQYLCDLAGLTCYTVDGDMRNETGRGGAHMWNIVYFGNQHYLVDITNCDTGSTGYPDKLFLAGTNVGSVSTGYKFPNCSNLSYVYSEDQESLLGKNRLTLASANFDPSVIAPLEVHFEKNQDSVLYREIFPEVEKPSVTSNGWEVQQAEISYQYRAYGSSVPFLEGLPLDVGTYEIKAVAEGDLYRRTESDNILILTIENSVANHFEDIHGYEWFFEYVESAYDRDLMKGISGTRQFQPEGNITKAQVAQVLYNMEGQPFIYDETVFLELKDVYAVEWYADAVAWAYQQGIITGDLYTKKFSPNASVTREQLALMIYRYADYKGYDVSGRGSLSGLKNDWKVNTYALEAVKWAVGEGLISGIEKNGVKDLAPQGTATRAQMATILTRFCESYDTDYEAVR